MFSIHHLLQKVVDEIMKMGVNTEDVLVSYFRLGFDILNFAKFCRTENHLDQSIRKGLFISVIPSEYIHIDAN